MKARARKSEKADLTVESLLGKIVKGKGLLKRRKGAKLFSQGEEADAVYFIQTGRSSSLLSRLRARRRYSR
jgi:CRP-like cAMP-binding protein